MPVLVDTNVILEAHRTGSWRALRGGHRPETVEGCVAETGAGAQNRRPERRIDEATPRADLKAVHAVTDRERAVAVARDGPVASLDGGEQALWSHALAHTDAWVLCGPDGASLRLGARPGSRDRLAAPEALLDAVDHRPKTVLRRNDTSARHREAVARFALEEGVRPA